MQQHRVIRKEIQGSNGQVISIETGLMARQAHGSAVVQMGKTVLLATVVSRAEPEKEPDFLPLSVDYQERFSAAGKIPGGFFKREGRPSEHEVLICRLVDRALRPLFPEDYFSAIQINISLISADKNVPPDSLAALAASSALCVSDIPFGGPISEVRVIKTDEGYVINPSLQAAEAAKLNLIVAATADDIMMVEGSAQEASEEEILAAMKAAHEAIKVQCAAQKELEAEVGSTQKRDYVKIEEDQALYERLKTTLYDKLHKAAAANLPSKKAREQALKDIKNEYKQLPENEEMSPFLFNRYVKKIQREALRRYTLDSGKRLDGRGVEDIRPIDTAIDVLPSAHGSALFTRGETQSLTTVTLGTKLDEQMLDGATVSGFKKVLLHYNFPGFSTGEVKPNRGASRREIGHGNLALRALTPVLPPEEENAYTIRIVSDILESNGSSSMATVCAGSLALMDAGVSVHAPVSGIAMGLLKDESDQYVILSDILGEEDQLGDLDFKVAGTRKGITACQMDIKLSGLSYEILEKALAQARRGRLHILDEMEKAIAQPRDNHKSHAPQAHKMTIPASMIGAVIGPGGKVVQEIQRESGATIAIEEANDQGEIQIFAPQGDAMEKAIQRIKDIIALPEVGEVYAGTVRSIMPYGAFVEFLPGKTGLLHISEISWTHLKDMENTFKEGEEVEVKLVHIDKKTGKYRLSRKALLPKPEEAA